MARRAMSETGLPAEGPVKVAVFVNWNGQMGESIILESLLPDLDAAALKAVKSIRFDEILAYEGSEGEWIVIPDRFKGNKKTGDQESDPGGPPDDGPGIR